MLALLLLRRRRWSVTVEPVQPLPPALPEPPEDEGERLLQVLRERQDGESAPQRELQRLAQERPAEVAAVIKSWLAEK
jgi:flagellar biosynthesis/type III secretory pathway M-ring protein FliF/YscJ